jgi:D-alanyl-D-alanine-carboxypeptidase/D-alanyl-D-alanine-endopeptidase
MLTFLAAQLQPESTTMAEAIALSQQERHHSRRIGIALGWVVTGRSGKPILGHNGATGGFTSFAGFAPEAQSVVVLFANSRRGPEPAALRLLSQLRGHLRRQDFAPFRDDP